MASPKPESASIEIPLIHHSPGQFYMLSVKAIERCGWRLMELRADGWSGITALKPGPQESQIRMEIRGNVAKITLSSDPEHAFSIPEKFSAFKSAIENLAGELESAKLEEEYTELQKLIKNPELLDDNSSPFIPGKTYLFTPILIYANVLIFILMVISGVSIIDLNEEDIEKVIDWGANVRSLTVAGDYWRLLTSCFLHFGILHLLMNMYALMYIGAFLEPMLGKARFILTYLITGIAASTISIWWLGDYAAAGASGAIFGMYGCFLALLTTKLVPAEARIQLLSSIGIFVVYNLINGFRPGSGVDNAAHVGGLLSGFAAGFILFPALIPGAEQTRKALLTSGMVAVLLGISGGLLMTVKDESAEYERLLKSFTALEEEAIEAYNSALGMPLQDAARQIEEEGITKWEKAMDLANEMDALEVPGRYHEQARFFKPYLELRLRQYHLVADAFKKGDEPDPDELEAIKNQITAYLATAGD